MPYNIPDNSLLSVWYEGDTDAGNYSSIEEKSAFSIDGNKVIVELVAQMLLKPGKGELCLSVTHGDGGETNTWNIPYCVEYKPGAGSAVPTEYYTALTDAASRAAEQVGLAAEQVGLAAEQAEIAKEEALKAQEYAEQTADKLPTNGGKMYGDIDMSGFMVSNLNDPENDGDATNKFYVDERTQAYIVDQGISNNWLYRKWNSGLLECWSQADVIISDKLTQLGSVYCTDIMQVPYPFVFSSDNPLYRYATVANSGILNVQSYGGDRNGFAFRLHLAATSLSGQTATIFLYVVGKI